jgi:DNA-binding LytR/AlgR family response regulator
MIKVSIIENDNYQIAKFKTYITKAINENNLDMEVEYCTSDIKDFMYNIEWDDSRRVYFIGIDLGGDINGIDLAVFIRKYDKNGYIVFTNSFGDFNQIIIEHKVKVARVIKKMNDSELEVEVKDCLLKVNAEILDEEWDKERIFSVIYGNRKLELEKDEIMFIEGAKSGKKIVIHGVNRQIELRGNIKTIQEKIGKGFDLVNKSLLINSKNINEVNKEKTLFVMSNGERVFIGDENQHKLE